MQTFIKRYKLRSLLSSETDQFCQPIQRFLRPVFQFRPESRVAKFAQFVIQIPSAILVAPAQKVVQRLESIFGYFAYLRIPFDFSQVRFCRRHRCSFAHRRFLFFGNRPVRARSERRMNKQRTLYECWQAFRLPTYDPAFCICEPPYQWACLYCLTHDRSPLGGAPGGRPTLECDGPGADFVDQY